MRTYFFELAALYCARNFARACWRKQRLARAKQRGLPSFLVSSCRLFDVGDEVSYLRF
jgi:hypothetical protein